MLHPDERRQTAAAAAPDQATIGEVLARYQLDLDFGTIPQLAERHGLRLG